ncbi:hypothetical protein D3C84_883690 [compost metagenome]
MCLKSARIAWFWRTLKFLFGIYSSLKLVETLLFLCFASGLSWYCLGKARISNHETQRMNRRDAHDTFVQSAGALPEYLPDQLEGGFLAWHIRVNFALLKINISLIVGLSNWF